MTLKPSDYKNKTPLWVYKLPWNQIKEVCSKYAIPSQLLASIIMTESSGNPLAKRFEPNWKYFYDLDNFEKKFEKEKENQATSFGLVQLMGSCFRELGYIDDLAGCFDQNINLDYGARKLAGILKKYPDWYSATSAYNHGSPWRNPQNGFFINADYVNKVRSYLRSFNIGTNIHGPIETGISE